MTVKEFYRKHFDEFDGINEVYDCLTDMYPYYEKGGTDLVRKMCFYPKMDQGVINEWLSVLEEEYKEEEE